jgi:hypothetical protein
MNVHPLLRVRGTVLFHHERMRQPIKHQVSSERVWRGLYMLAQVLEDTIPCIWLLGTWNCCVAETSFYFLVRLINEGNHGKKHQ